GRPVLDLHRDHDGTGDGMKIGRLAVALALVLAGTAAGLGAEGPARAFFKSHCYECHDAQTREGGLDLSALEFDLSRRENFARWVKVHDRIVSGEMPPRYRDRPPADRT